MIQGIIMFILMVLVVTSLLASYRTYQIIETITDHLNLRYLEELKAYMVGQFAIMLIMIILLSVELGLLLARWSN